jgi:xeroderma pigmentosum group C-complementing protein
LNSAVQHGGSSSEEDVDAATALYTEIQTELYVPPPVENGIVPKNTYGNIDVYTPSMVPAGGTHLVRPSISLAAQFAGIDYADAVTGFDFVRNRASPRLNGIVVASENVEGLLAVWEGMMERVTDEEERRRLKAVFERWRRFLVGMGIRRRLDETHGKLDDLEESMVNEDGMYIDDDVHGETEFGAGVALESETANRTNGGDARHSDPHTNQNYVQLNGSPEAGQLHPGSEQPPMHDDMGDDQQPLASHHSIMRDSTMKINLVGGFELASSESASGGFFLEQDEGDQDGIGHQDDDSEGGGFIFEDEDGIL